MAIPIFKHFDKYTVEERINIRIYDENQKMVMIGIQCEDQDMVNLHNHLRNLSRRNKSIPMVLPPSQFGDSPRIRMAVRCPDAKIIESFRDTWFFEFALSYNRLRKKWNKKPFYASLIFKRVILNLISIVEAFLQTNFRPVLQTNKIFVSSVGDVIFSQYEVRDPFIADHYAEEARQVGDILKLLVYSKVGNNSETLTAEFQELATWLLSTRFQPGSDVREQVVFWDQTIRMHYIRELFEEVSARHYRDAQIFSLSKDAFKVGTQTNWRHILQRTPQHPVLRELISIGDAHFVKAQQSGKGPSEYRSDVTTGKTPEKILCCGLAKMRDGYCHDGDNEDKLSPFYEPGKQVRDIQLQSMFQDVFPSHMLEFAKSKHLIDFNAAEFVQQLLDRTYIEDATSSVDKYLA